MGKSKYAISRITPFSIAVANTQIFCFNVWKNTQEKGNKRSATKHSREEMTAENCYKCLNCRARLINTAGLQTECRWKDTVSEEDENDEVERIEHSAAFNATLRPDGVVHNLVPVFPGQYLQRQHRLLTRNTCSPVDMRHTSLATRDRELSRNYVTLTFDVLTSFS